MPRFCSVLLLATVFISVLSAQDKQFTDDWDRAANSPGSALTLRETGRNGASGRTVVSYRLFASGLPKGQHFTLWTWNLGNEPQAVADAFINSEGLIVNRLGDATNKEDPIDVRAVAGRGEKKDSPSRRMTGSCKRSPKQFLLPLNRRSTDVACRSKCLLRTMRK
jgi:hypothetical protein